MFFFHQMSGRPSLLDFARMDDLKYVSLVAFTDERVRPSVVARMNYLRSCELFLGDYGSIAGRLDKQTELINSMNVGRKIIQSDQSRMVRRRKKVFTN